MTKSDTNSGHETTNQIVHARDARNEWFKKTAISLWHKLAPTPDTTRALPIARRLHMAA